tara:strand:- start:6294 stop:6629 length:336 start_codon:yes stop_codon:yes gene_type:complete
MPLNTHILNDTVEIQRITASGTDSRGNISDDWSTLAASANCRKVSGGTAEDRDGRNTIVESLTLYFGETVDVKASDRIKDGTKYYEIIAINTVRDSKGDDCYTVASCLFRE